MATSPNYAWAEPDNSSLVKNGAQDIRALGDAIDTSVWNVGYGQAGKNKIINGDFSINQRGFTSTTSNIVFTYDRFSTTTAGGTSTFSAQTFTPGAAPVAGYESTNFIRIASTGQSAASDNTRYRHKIEDVRTFAGQTVTLSFWAKAGSGTPSIAAYYTQAFGSGGSTAVTINGQKKTLSTSWARYSVTLAIPSISGKTIGAGSYLELLFVTSAGSDYNDRTESIGIQTATIDIWGVQVEAGSYATPFQTASGGSIQGELAACQRYYQKSYDQGTALATVTTAGLVGFQSPNCVASGLVGAVHLPVNMRTGPTVTIYSYNGTTAKVSDAGATDLAANSGVAIYIGQSGFSVQNQSGGTITAAYNGFICHFAASAEL